MIRDNTYVDKQVCLYLKLIFFVCVLPLWVLEFKVGLKWVVLLLYLTDLGIIKFPINAIFFITFTG